MDKKVVGQVTIEERDMILKLFERKNALNELVRVVGADNDALYEKLVADLGETTTRFQHWWDDMSEKYQWESSKNGSWEINFETCEILLT